LHPCGAQLYGFCNLHKYLMVPLTILIFMAFLRLPIVEVT
jgi:hypothetical protein